MCILCVVQKWSRRAIGMLPWLVIPFILLWALSQLFPPDLRFEITSPRLACVVVLLGTIFWYEILLPHLSVYRARRCARIREQQLNFAIELQKLRKTATRRCRNCLTPYRDQKPGGGKFMCSYCGHVSKRPILDIPGPPGSSGIFGNLIRKSGWFFNLECPAWEGHANPAPRHWREIQEEETCSRATIFVWKLLSSVFCFSRNFCRRVLRLNFPAEDGSSDSDHRESSKDGEHVSQESKGEKARRKAEEKRQARLEKEMLEEEERKQREEVARLIEERRKLRDEQLEADRERSKDLALDGSRDGRKEELDKRRRERKRQDRERNSSKSNSDGEDQDVRGKKEAEKKRELERKNSNVTGSVYKPKSTDHTKATSLFSSRSPNGWMIFGKNLHPSAVAASKSSRPTFARRENSPVLGHPSGKPLPMNAALQPAVLDRNQQNTPKKAWHQLFTRPVENVVKNLENHTLPHHPPSANDILPAEPDRSFVVDEAELFQDPCFVPDPTSLIGPVSESLDEFFADPAIEFKDNIPRRACDPSEVKKPAPIESPMSKLWTSKDRQVGSGSCSPKSQDQSTLTDTECDKASEHGTWQMWSSSLCKDGLDLVGGPASWLSALRQSKSTEEEQIQSRDIMGKAGNDGMLSPWDPKTSPLSFPSEGDSLFPHIGFPGAGRLNLSGAVSLPAENTTASMGSGNETLWGDRSGSFLFSFSGMNGG